MNDNNTLFKRIWQAAESAPDKIIVKDFQRNWTWRELIGAANAYAHALQTSSNDSIIPIFVGRTGETIAAILGCLFAGRAFAPLSGQQPRERIVKCLERINSQKGINVSESILPQLPIAWIQSEKVGFLNELPPAPSENSLTDLLYVLFTSGSTGMPKGVMVNYQNLINTMEWSQDILNWNAHDVMGGGTNFYFDISVFDVFTMLYWNIPLGIFSDLSDTTKIVEEVDKFGVTSIFSAPVFFSQLLRGQWLEKLNQSSLKRILSGGDFFPPPHILKWMEDAANVEIWNVWGPTETSIVNTMYKVTNDDVPLLKSGKAPSIGRAHTRMPFIVVDEDGKVINEAQKSGEIWMLGTCVTQGYLGADDLTAKSYVWHEGQRAYRTQDIGYFDELNNLFISGRMGSMVKLSGHRVDLGEVESAAIRITEVHLAGAFVREIDAGISELWLGVEPKDRNKEFDIYTLKQKLRELLPNYMVPKRILIYDEIPKNANGKINRRAMAESVFT